MDVEADEGAKEGPVVVDEDVSVVWSLTHSLGNYKNNTPTALGKVIVVGR